MNRFVFGILILFVSVGCQTKNVEVHYQHVATCARWSDFGDDPANSYTQPLLIFKLVSAKNVSASGAGNAEFDLSKAFYQGANEKHFPENGTAIPTFGTTNTTLTPGEMITTPFPGSGWNGHFAIQLWKEGYSKETLINLVPHLIYESPAGYNVLMILDYGPDSYHDFCGLTQLSNL